MSTEFQLAWPCEHRTVEEVVSLGDDRRSLLTRQPIAGSGTVRVMVNDELYIPQGGYFSSAQLFSTTSGPYDIEVGHDQFIVSTPAGTATVNFGVKSTTRMSASDIIKFLQKTQFQVAQVTDSNGHLVFTDLSKIGPDSFVQVSGTAAGPLGFGEIGCGKGAGLQRGARGAQAYPSWSLSTRPDDLVNRFPKFDYPVKGNPVFKVSYTVIPQRCLRCGGTWVENDYRYGIDGQALMIANEDLLYQSCLKVLLTDKGSNPYHTWYGTNLRSKIGSKAISGVAMALSEDVRSALSKFQSVQKEQSGYQQISFRERLYSITNVQVSPHRQDPTTYMIDVTVRNAANVPITLSIIFTVPTVVALMGSNGLMLGTQAVGLASDKIMVPNVLTVDGIPAR